MSKSLINQLLRAKTSVDTNLKEAIAGQSKADFIHKNLILLKEAKESNFWLRLILETSDFNQQIKFGIQDLES